MGKKNIENLRQAISSVPCGGKTVGDFGADVVDAIIDVVSHSVSDKYSTEVVEQAVQMYRDGVMLSEIERKLGVSDSSVVRYAKKLGVRRRQLIPRGLSRAEKSKIVKLYKGGEYSQAELGNKFSVSAETIRKVIRKSKVQFSRSEVRLNAARRRLRRQVDEQRKSR